MMILVVLIHFLNMITLKDSKITIKPDNIWLKLRAARIALLHTRGKGTKYQDPVISLPPARYGHGNIALNLCNPSTNISEKWSRFHQNLVGS
jgi:hypothetical protein